MSIIWTIILLFSIGALLFSNPALSLTSMLEGAGGAMELTLRLTALYGFWLGLFNILEKLGIADVIAKLLSPLVKFLFRTADEKTRKFISMNMAANILGLGNAATPMGISAINSMYTGQKKASTDMIMLVVISGTSLQLLPTTVIGMRSSFGAANPADFLIPCIVSTVISTVIGVALVKIISRILPDADKQGRTKKIKNGGQTARRLPLSVRVGRNNP